MAASKEPYGMDPLFERAVLTLCACRPRFWGRVGQALDPECVELPEGKPLLQAVRQIAKDLGHGPDSLLVTLQRLRRFVADGKIEAAAVAAIGALFDEAEDYGLPDEDAAVAELAPLLRRRLEAEAILEAMDAHGRRADLGRVLAKLEHSARLGAADAVSLGTRLVGGGFEEIGRMATLQRMPTGVMELDLNLEDGLPRGQLGMAIGDSGGGKSMWLVQMACEALRRQVHTVYATLELPKPVQLARLYANLTGIPTNGILSNPADQAEAKRRIEMMAPHIGACLVEDFPPHVTTVRDVLDWARRCENDLGDKVGCVVVDYADKMFDPRARDGNEYVAMRYVYEGLRRDLAVARDCWVWTASQAKRPSKDNGKRLDLQSVADSMHKVRVADLVITLNAHEDGGQVAFYVAKNRTGKARFQVGPVPTDFDRARIVPATAEFMAW